MFVLRKIKYLAVRKWLLANDNSMLKRSGLSKLISLKALRRHVNTMCRLKLLVCNPECAFNVYNFCHPRFYLNFIIELENDVSWMDSFNRHYLLSIILYWLRKNWKNTSSSLAKLGLPKLLISI